ncbi:MAG: tetratricopeptide repeat protein [Pseudomonadota bacterium]
MSSDIDEKIRQALTLQRSGELGAAEALYREVLQAEPGNAGVLHLLGLVYYQSGRHEDALRHINAAIALHPTEALFHFNLGKIQSELGTTDDAAARYREAIKLQPNYAEAHINLGNLLKQQNKFAEAEHHYRQALMVNNTSAKTWLSLAQVVHAQNRLDEALHYYKNVLQIAPDHIATLLTVGDLLREKGDPEQAEQCYRKVLAIDPSRSATHNILGVTLQMQGKKQEAIQHFQRAVEIEPGYAQAYNNLGIAHLQTGQLESALLSFQRAVELRPDYAEAYCNLGQLYNSLGDLDQTEKYYRKGLECNPNLPIQHSDLLLMLHYKADFPAEQLYADHARWGEQFCPPQIPDPRSWENTRDPARRLKVGWVSPDFRNHAVAYFLEAALSALPREQIEVCCYAEARQEDEVTHQLKRLADHWLNTMGMSDVELANRIRADRIDILVDLAGHTAHNRLMVFARKAAPIQATWLGYCNTSGLRTMDYLLADEWVIPRDTRQQFSERICRLPQSYLCFKPRDYAPEICPPPAVTTGHITFGCFNNLKKITPQAIALWAKLLRQLPTSKLLLKVGHFSAEKQNQYRARFVEQGTHPEQVEFITGKLPHQELLNRYRHIDIALDTFPYNGVTTTCEALWMGVPVVTLAGDTFIGRNGVSILNNVGLPELVAETPQQYLDIALGLIRDPARLASLRQGMRQRFADSPLGNPEQFARNLEQAFRTMWQEWCTAH